MKLCLNLQLKIGRKFSVPTRLSTQSYVLEWKFLNWSTALRWRCFIILNRVPHVAMDLLWWVLLLGCDDRPYADILVCPGASWSWQNLGLFPGVLSRGTQEGSGSITRSLYGRSKSQPPPLRPHLPCQGSDPILEFIFTLRSSTVNDLWMSHVSQFWTKRDNLALGVPSIAQHRTNSI